MTSHQIHIAAHIIEMAFTCWALAFIVFAWSEHKKHGYRLDGQGEQLRLMLDEANRRKRESRMR